MAVSRRIFLKSLPVLGTAALLAACAPGTGAEVNGSTPTSPYVTGAAPDPLEPYLPENFDSLEASVKEVAAFQAALYTAYPPAFWNAGNQLPSLNLMEMPNPSIIPGFENSSPSEAEYMEALAKLNIPKADDYGEFGEKTLADPVVQTVLATPLVAGLAQAETAAILDPIPGDELVLGALLLTTAGLTALSLYKYNKNAPQVRNRRNGRYANGNGHSHPSHDPKDPNKGHIARRIIQEVSQKGEKVPVVCYMVLGANRVARVIKALPVIGTADRLSHLAWYEMINGQATGWGGAYTFVGNAANIDAVRATAKWGGEITKLSDDYCRTIAMPGANQYR